MAVANCFSKVTVSQKAEKSLRGGHPWVFADEVREITGRVENGDLVDVFSEKDKYLGTGFLSEASKIRVRVISRNRNDTFDDAFFERRIRHAVAYRRTVMGADFSCSRLIFGEADFFPGLTVDLFQDVLVAEVLSYGMERIKDRIFTYLVEALREEGVNVRVLYERNDSHIRTLEGLPTYCGFWSGAGLATEDEGRVQIRENGILYNVEYISGQKTGFFLDQKYNRLAAARLAPGKRVLDCCTHTGAFALNCAAAGAAHVTAVDISEDALACARANAELNGLSEKMDFVCADVFELLKSLEAKNSREYDYIILDPPAFTKSHATLKNAIRGYRQINALAMKILPRGGYLATCSCSHFMTVPYFKQMLHDAAEDSAVSLRQIEERKQSPDHPVLWNVPETEYLKFFTFQVF